MAEHKYQQQDSPAGLQHLANLNQDSAHHQGDSVLQHQAQALLVVQDLERQRLHQVLPHHQVGEQPQ